MKPKRRILMLFFMTGLPVILIFTGLLDFRITQQHGTAPLIARYETILKELDAAQAQGQHYVRWRDDEGNISFNDIDVARIYANQELASLRPGSLKATILDIHSALDWITVAGGALALAWAVAGRVILRRLARQAMQSREALLSAFSRGQKLLPGYIVFLTLILSVPLMTAVVLASAPILAGNYGSQDQSPVFDICAVIFIAILFGLGASIAVVRTARRAIAPQPRETLGSMVSREQAPGLWAFVERIAERVGTRMPDSIIVGLDHGFFVTEQPVRLRDGNPVPPGRVLYMPRPYLAFLNETEVSAIVGHEMGHFIGEDAIYSQKFLPIYLAATRQIKTVSAYAIRRNIVWGAAIFGEIFVEFLSIFHKAMRHWEHQFNREHQRELAADAVGVRVAGTQASAVALLRIAALFPRINAALGHYLDQGATAKDNVMADVRRRIAAQGLADPREQLANCPTHPAHLAHPAHATNTHPQLAERLNERLEALGVSPADPALLKLAMNPAASSLLRDWGLEPPCARTFTPDQTPYPAGASNMPDASGVSDKQASAVSSSAALQQELRQAAASIQQEKIDELTHVAAQAENPQAIRDFKGLVIPMVISVITLLIPFLWGSIVILIRIGPQTAWADITNRENAAGTFSTFVLFLLFGVLPGFCLGKILHACLGPSVVLSRQGLQLPGAPRIVPWNDIISMSTSIASVRFNNVARIYLTFAHGIEPASFVGKSRKLRYDKREKRWVLSFKCLSKDVAPNVATTVMKYWVAGRARAELQRMGVKA